MEKFKSIIREHFPKGVGIYRYFTKKFHYYRKKFSSAQGKRKILEKAYYNNLGVPLNLDNPKRYTEKIQWTKLYGITPEMSLLTDKYRVREWVSNKIGGEYLIPLINSVKSYKEIDFESLPQQFVIKSNNSSGWNIIVRDKSQIDMNDVKKKIKKWSKTNYAFYSTLEMQYASIKPVFLIEEFINDSKRELNDYKFLCFDGKPYYCWVDTGRFKHHRRTVYDLNWVRQPWSQVYNPSEVKIDKPQNFDQMVQIATELCQGFHHVRVDLYNVDGKIYFGEMTFTNSNGFAKIVPDEYDEILGSLWKLPNRTQ